jgi:serine/threonine protein kinase
MWSSVAGAELFPGYDWGAPEAPDSLSDVTANVSAPPAPTPQSVPTDRLTRSGSAHKDSDCCLDPKPIAAGGQATVFGAVHEPTNLRVAFKRLTGRGPDQLARMRREAEAAQMFGDHPNMMPVLDFSPSHDWLVMPLAEDSVQTTAAELTDPQRLRDLVTAVCEALREPHQRGWIHRDLKPDNILTRDQRWRVADYVTLKYDDVDGLVTWLLVAAYHAEHLDEWDLLEDTAEAILYLDQWDRVDVRRDIHAWLASRSRPAASIVANALRRNPDVLPHFASLASDATTDHRIRSATRGPA